VKASSLASSRCQRSSEPTMSAMVRNSANEHMLSAISQRKVRVLKLIM
jgi:hypothetical protein